MTAKSEFPLKKVILNLYDGEKEVLQQFYPAIGYGAVIRTLVHNHCSKLRERASREGVNSDVGTELEPDITGLIGGSEDGSQLNS